MTTIRVSSDLRDRINRGAHEHGLTAAGWIDQLVAAEERNARMAAFGRAMTTADDDYWDEFRAWDATVGDGVDA